MCQAVLFVVLLLVHYSTQDRSKFAADCDQNVSLPCLDVTSFFTVTWYKLGERKQGIIKRSKGDNDTKHFAPRRNASFGERHSLFLPNVKPTDSGSYQCFIHGNLGGKNQFSDVNLVVHECVTQAASPTSTSVLTTIASTSLCHKQHQDLPVMWSVIGYVAVALAKIALSLISILVIHIRSSK
ncbi:uncharacterized protein [Embiotoca jacksoni]|uniref:uncharacterized protein n=1 Tax=Embiotoca jacksoni TaxID=100190 RepID=UPI0037039E1E